ncbi:glutathione S-transferase N-terminal domain-containing protein [Staphylococcus epidermidis]|nr:glutathione S-transferase N-terminal domain-containing protein [Staphylococcus epidermidis]
MARVIALEKGLNPELVWCDPWANDPALPAVHPQARIPVLLTEDGHAIAESADCPVPGHAGSWRIAARAGDGRHLGVPCGLWRWKRPSAP